MNHSASQTFGNKMSHFPQKHHWSSPGNHPAQHTLAPPHTNISSYARVIFYTTVTVATLILLFLGLQAIQHEISARIGQHAYGKTLKKKKLTPRDSPPPFRSRKQYESVPTKVPRKPMLCYGHVSHSRQVLWRMAQISFSFIARPSQLSFIYMTLTFSFLCIDYVYAKEPSCDQTSRHCRTGLWWVDQLLFRRPDAENNGKSTRRSLTHN